MKTGRKGVALGYGAPAKQSTGANEVSEADERIAKCGTADPNEVRDTQKKLLYMGENGEIMTKEEFSKIDKFGVGEPNEAFAKYFTGQSFLKPLTDAKKGEIPIFNVTFEPGCRNNWHVHHAAKGGGQVLICTAGSGWYQEWGKDAFSMEEGSVVVIPANVKHWHGAKKDSWFSHITFEPAGEGKSNEWLEPVSDEEYGKLGE